MFTYEVRTNSGKESMFIISKDDGTMDSIQPVGSLYLLTEQESLIEKLIKGLNDWDTAAKRRSREGISTVTGEIRKDSQTN